MYTLMVLESQLNLKAELYTENIFDFLAMLGDMDFKVQERLDIIVPATSVS